jgi:hypothetical protein
MPASPRATTTSATSRARIVAERTEVISCSAAIRRTPSSARACARSASSFCCSSSEIMIS